MISVRAQICHNDRGSRICNGGRVNVPANIDEQLDNRGAMVLKERVPRLVDPRLDCR